MPENDVECDLFSDPCHAVILPPYPSVYKGFVLY